MLLITALRLAIIALIWFNTQGKVIRRGTLVVRSLINLLKPLQKWERGRSQVQSRVGSHRPKATSTQIPSSKKAATDLTFDAVHDLLQSSLYHHALARPAQPLEHGPQSCLETLMLQYIGAVRNSIINPIEASISTTYANDRLLKSRMLLEDSLKLFGRSALVLSGGAALGMKHIGVVKALWQAKLLPKIISGASAGSIVAAIVATQSENRILAVLEQVQSSDLAVFDPPGTGRFGWVRERLRTTCRSGVLFKADNLERVMRSWLGDITFREAHRNTGRILNISISSPGLDKPKVLNHLTAPNVLIWSAVCASCAVPVLFSPIRLHEKSAVTSKEQLWIKHKEHPFSDGSLEHDVPQKQLAKAFNVSFLIVAQVKPHIRPFWEPEENRCRVQRTSNQAASASGMLYSIKQQLKIWAFQLTRNYADSILPQNLFWRTSIFDQRYIGDVNTLPEYRYREILRLMANPTPDFTLQATSDGEKATLVQLPQI